MYKKGATSVKISVNSEKEHVHHGGVFSMTLYRTDIRYSHGGRPKKHLGGGLIPGFTI